MSKPQKYTNRPKDGPLKSSKTKQKQRLRREDREPQDNYERYLGSKNGEILYNSPSSCLNPLFFLETNKILDYGEHNRYEFDSLFRVNSELTHEEISPKFEYEYNKAVAEDPDASYLDQAYKVIGKNQFTGSCMIALAFIFQVFNPPLLKHYLNWLQDEENEAAWKGWVYLVLLLAISYIKPLFTQNSVHYLNSTLIQMELLNRA